MSLSKTSKVSIDLARIRSNVQAILAQTAVPVIAVVKADAYGLGAVEIAKTIGDLVDAFYVFDSTEAVNANLWQIAHRRIIALNSDWKDPNDFLSHHVQPVVWSMDRAHALRSAKPVLSIDTGQQRFSCPASQAVEVCHAGDCREIMTHAVTLPQVDRFVEIVSGWRRDELFLHAAGSALLEENRARLNAVRPGLAMYRGAVQVSARLVEVRDSAGPAGYTGFAAARFGVVLAGYSQGLRRGPCRVNGEIRQVIEVGMQSAFVTLGPGDHRGDEVVLLGDETDIDLPSVARAWGTSQQEVLVRMTKLGTREYV